MPADPVDPPPMLSWNEPAPPLPLPPLSDELWQDVAHDALNLIAK